MKYTKELHEVLANNLDIDFTSIEINGNVYTPSAIYSVLLGEISRLQEENRIIKLRWHLMAALVADKKLSCYGMKPDLQIYSQILKDMADVEVKNPLPQPPESEE